LTRNSQIWSEKWGEFFADREPIDHKGKIARLEARMKDLPVRSLMTNNQLSYGPIRKPYAELGNNYRRRTFGKFDEFSSVALLTDDEEATRGCESCWKKIKLR